MGAVGAAVEEDWRWTLKAYSCRSTDSHPRRSTPHRHDSAMDLADPPRWRVGEEGQRCGCYCGDCQCCAAPCPPGSSHFPHR